MDIYRLSNKPGFVITDLKLGVKNQDRVNVYVNDKFAFSLDVAQVVDFKIKKGLAVSEDRLLELKKASEYGKLYQRTLEWVLLRPHSESETRDYLRKKIFEKKLDKSYIDRIIEKLKTKKYLDDYRFAEWYVEYLTGKKNFSIKRIKMELRKKGIANDIVDELLERTENYEAKKLSEIIAKKRSKYPDEKKLIAYLCRQGFDYQLVNELVRSSEMD
ncbi:RecX family transcriptional regulator [Candidatus Saccharibacteria bacterium]|nr:RecX family transcriptional regulator [Candidatus Saccharibacteria bacterium]